MYDLSVSIAFLRTQATVTAYVFESGKEIAKGNPVSGIGKATDSKWGQWYSSQITSSEGDEGVTLRPNVPYTLGFYIDNYKSQTFKFYGWDLRSKFISSPDGLPFKEGDFARGLEAVKRFKDQEPLVPTGRDMIAWQLKMKYIEQSNSGRRLMVMAPRTEVESKQSVITMMDRPGSTLSLSVCLGGLKTEDAEAVRNVLESTVVLGAKVELLNSRPCRLSNDWDGLMLEFRVTSLPGGSDRLRLPTRLQTELYTDLGVFVPIEEYNVHMETTPKRDN